MAPGLFGLEAGRVRQESGSDDDEGDVACAFQRGGEGGKIGFACDVGRVRHDLFVCLSAGARDGVDVADVGAGGEPGHEGAAYSAGCAENDCLHGGAPSARS